MFEELLSLAILSEIHLIDSSVYFKKLDTYFLDNSKNERLLELEFLYSHTNDAIYKLHEIRFSSKFNDQLFGSRLFQKIEQVYSSGEFSIYDFGQKMYLIWDLYLPKIIREEEPFWTLSYADDCLYYGDEQQTRELYEKAFKFYQYYE